MLTLEGGIVSWLGGNSIDAGHSHSVLNFNFQPFFAAVLWDIDAQIALLQMMQT